MNKLVFALLVLVSLLTISLASGCALGGQAARVTVASPDTVNRVEAKVARVVDGDTIVLENGETVRYLGIDAPETVNPNMAPEFYGQEATDKNRELVEGRTVSLEKDVSDRDHYGRLLRYVSVGNVFVNAELVRGGYAYEASRPSDSRYRSLLRKLEQEAREQHRGLWAEWPTPLPSIARTGGSR